MNEERCEEFRELASAYADDRLEREDLLRLDRHLGECPGCREFERGVRRSRELLLAGEAVSPLRRPPPGFAGAVMRRVAAEAGPGTRVVPFPAARPPRLWAGLAVAAAAAAVFFAWSWFRLLPTEQGLRADLPQRIAPVQLAREEGSMEDHLERHASLARAATILGPAAEVDFVARHAVVAPGR
jgi:predicted anti-sigma-YlaC factor YlaD